MTCVLAATGIPAPRRFANASIAASKLPARPEGRRASREGRRSTPTRPGCPARFAASARSRVRPRPPVVIEHCIPCARTARTISVQSSRRYASPPMSVTSLTPSSAIWRTRSSACSGRHLFGPLTPGARPAVPAREVAPQRDLPHGVDGLPRLVDRPRRIGERQVPSRAGGRRRDGQRDRAGAESHARTVPRGSGACGAPPSLSGGREPTPTQLSPFRRPAESACPNATRGSDRSTSPRTGGP